MCPPALQSRSRSCTSTLGELLLRCVVSHRIAPGEFLSGGFYVQAPVQFHPPRRALSARPKSSGEKLTVNRGKQLGRYGSCQKPSTLLRSWILSSATRVSAERLSPWLQRHQWSCSRCKAHHSVHTRAKKPLSKECSAQLFAALFAGRVPPSDSELPEPQRPPNPEAQRPKTSVPPLFLARDSQPSHSPEELSVNQVPTKSKSKAKAKPKANSVVASFFKTNHR